MRVSAEEEFELEPDLVRAVAKEEISSLIESRRLLSEQHSHSFRWLVASLLAINSGAIVATLNTQNLSGQTKVEAGFLFSLGICLSLMVAYSSQKLANFLMPPIQQKIGYWLGVLQDGEICNEAETPIAQKAQRILKFKWVPEIFGWFALLSFLGGLALLGLEISNEGQSNSQDLQVIESNS